MDDIDLTVIARDVEAVREELKPLLKLLPKKWRLMAVEIDPYFNTIKGYRSLQVVVNGRSRLEITRRVLAVVKIILETTPEPQPDQSPESAGKH